MEKQNCSIHKNCNFSQITQNIYIGTDMYAKHHFATLTSIGIAADINLEMEHFEYPKKIAMFLWLPTADLTPPSPTQLRAGSDFIASLVSQNKKVYVHCRMGHGRSPTLVAAYFILLQGNSFTEAINQIKKQRPEIHLEKVQVDALEEFSTIVNGKI